MPAPLYLKSVWEYSDSPKADGLLADRSAQILAKLRKDPQPQSLAIATDTRQAHGHLFNGLTPKGQPFFAGKYRGQYPEPLLSCQCFINGEQKTPPRFVVSSMVGLRSNTTKKIQELDAKRASTDETDFLIELVDFTAAFFCDFVRIHPFANGNGHAGRLALTAILGRYDRWLKKWTVHPRPKEPYLEAQKKYFVGEKAPLQKLILEDLLG
jgi:fido (protein-threonine AMPylation protein)